MPRYNDISPQGKIILLAAAIGIGMMLFWLTVNLWVNSGKLRLQVIGEGVEKLTDKTPVIMAGQPIGKVTGLRLFEGQRVASIVIETLYADQVIEGSTFRIISANTIMPGNLVLQVIPPRPIEPAERTESGDEIPLPPRLPQNSVVSLESSLLPPELPSHFYSATAAVFLLITLIALIFSIVYHLSRIMVMTFLIASIAALIWFLFGSQIQLFSDAWL